MTRHLKSLAAAALAAALWTLPAQAGPALDAAKAACQIGEAIDGYLEQVPGASAPADAVAEMQEVNNGRRAVYQNTARENGVDLATVARLTGERQTQRAANAGECYRDDGGWKMQSR